MIVHIKYPTAQSLPYSIHKYGIDSANTHPTPPDRANTSPSPYASKA